MCQTTAHPQLAKTKPGHTGECKCFQCSGVATKVLAGITLEDLEDFSFLLKFPNYLSKRLHSFLSLRFLRRRPGLRRPRPLGAEAEGGLLGASTGAQVERLSGGSSAEA